ncbi:MAG TPA: dihydrofolate reductase family protein [Cyclobacteriaceae bacterium]|jgi:dihydrofolate reductase|nr:dihydrofolate reductase family protein [Cyclobacteriaceae bacterium]
MKSLKSKQHKTKFVAYVATSVDGRISLSKTKAPDWTSKEDWKFFQSKLKNVDAVIAGHNTYIAAQSHLMKRTTYVFSHTPKLQKGSVTFINPAKIQLKKYFEKYKTVAIVGGASVYQTMLDAGLLNELYVTIEPLVFGRGTEMFIGGTKTYQLKLVSTRKLNVRGTLLLHYQVMYSK